MQTLYETKLQELNALLLSGVPWKDLRDKRHEVTQLSIQLSRRKTAHPAAFPNRGVE
ncbi:hypothetical protein [Flavisolibacter nicotianae]|uniref:hypothetical protein n=1 Tax=Flavisolibacter nicotianae TaxID=2364882 RepID=UPI0013C3F865|nr:hypothetical protein [Flavisolibacter nicotianae]